MIDESIEISHELLARWKQPASGFSMLAMPASRPLERTL